LVNDQICRIAGVEFAHPPANGKKGLSDQIHIGNPVKRSGARIYRKYINTVQYIPFQKEEHRIKLNNLSRPLFMPAVHISMHVNKIPIHLVRHSL
jgi:hypothetical protein